MMIWHAATAAADDDDDYDDYTMTVFIVVTSKLTDQELASRLFHPSSRKQAH